MWRTCAQARRNSSATSTAQSANQEATARAKAQNADATAQTKATASAQSQARATAQAQANATATANAQGEKQANATATAQANATATVLPATQLSGNWRNTASNTQGLTRLIISNNGLTMSVRAFAKCTTSPSGECDWGTRQGSFNGFPFVISFTHDNQTDELTMTMFANSELQVVDVGSASGTNTYVFSKG